MTKMKKITLLVTGEEEILNYILEYIKNIEYPFKEDIDMLLVEDIEKLP